jgi:hypothetical protein
MRLLHTLTLHPTELKSLGAHPQTDLPDIKILIFSIKQKVLLIKIEEGDTRKCLEKKNGNFAISKLAVCNNRWWVVV